MLEVLKFILNCIVKFLDMLFSIDIGNNMNLGLLMCVVFIFLPLVIVFINFLKFKFLDEFDDYYDSIKRGGKK